MTLQDFGFVTDSGFAAAAAVLSFAAALLATFGFTPLARWFARRLGVVDSPDGQRKLQTRAVPLLGGVAVYGGFAVTVLLLLATSSLGSFAGRAPLVLLSLGLLCLIGLIDDVFNLPARWKLVGQVVSTLPLIAAGLWAHQLGCCGLTLQLGSWGIPLTILWYLAGINTINLLDGMDGLASTAGLCIALGIVLMGLVTGAATTVILAAAIAGALAGFLIYNRPPATIYLGDAGSMVIGLVLAILTLQVASDAAGRSSLTIMVVLMAVPIADTALAIVRRLLSGRKIWSPDRGHIHHRLLDRGFSTTYILQLVFGVCGLTGAIASLSRMVGWDAVAWSASGALGVVLVRARLIGYHEWSLSKHVLADWLLVRSSEMPPPEQLAAMPFDGAWDALIKVAETGTFRRMQLTVDGQDSRRQHFWTTANEHDEDNDLLTVEFTHHSATDGVCQLRVESVDQESTPHSQWRLLVDAARGFGRHWARHSHSVPVSGLRILAADVHAAFNEPGRSHRRAA